MAEHQALYRRWRPRQFSEVVNQTYAVRTLINALSSKGIGHAYLFAGPRGTGKTTVARLVAKAVNCAQRINGEPCNRCDACERIARGVSLDVVEIDGASNRGIDQIRKLREEVNFVPADVKYKVYIIDEVHMLTNEAFNALLKTLEEPPKRVIFIFATTESHKLPATVTSRCQAFAFTRIAPEAVVAHLKRICEAEGIEAEERALKAIASRCGGALRDALVTLEQVAAFAQSEAITREILETVLGLPSESLLKDVLQALLEKNPEVAITTLQTLSERGRDLELFLEELIRMSRDWLVQAVAKRPLPIETSVTDLARLTEHLLQLKRDIGRVWDKHIWLEVGMLQLTHIQQTDSTESLAKSKAPTPSPQPATQRPDLKEDAQMTDSSPELQTSPDAPEQAKIEPSGQEHEPSVSEPESMPSEDAWQTLLNSIRNERVAVYAYLVEGRPHLEGDRLRIAYNQAHRFHKESLEKSEIKTYVLEKAKAAYGTGLTLDVDFFNEAHTTTTTVTTDTETTKHSEKPSQLDEKTELVKRVLGGKIIT